MSGSRAERRSGRLAAAAMLGVVALTLGGCAQTRYHQGYIMDPALVATVQPGVDNKTSVQATLGRPSLVAAFDPSIWYYVSRDTKQFAFGAPKPVIETVLAVHFDRAGTVSAVDRTGLEKVASIHPNGDKTPTLGRKPNIIRDIFGNIGAGQSGQTGPTADNPDGGSGQ